MLDNERMRAYGGLHRLIAWLETKPADGTYNWESPNHCLLGQWWGETQGEYSYGAANEMLHSDKWLSALLGFHIGGAPDADNIESPNNSIRRARWTYGQALERAKYYRDNPALLIGMLGDHAADDLGLTIHNVVEADASISAG